MLTAIVGTALMWGLLYLALTGYDWWVHGKEDSIVIPFLRQFTLRR